MRGALAMAVTLALATCTAGAATARYPQSIVEIKVNDQADGPTLVVRRDTDGSLLIREADLAKLRLRVPSTDAVTVDGVRYYRFDAATGASVTFDDATQSVALMLPPSAFVTTRSQASAADVPPVTPAGLGGFLNYDLYGERVVDQTSLGGYFEAGVFGRLGVLTGTLIAQDVHGGRAQPTGTLDGSAVRLDTTWRIDFPERLETLRVGDSISTAGAWGRAARFGGIQFGTNFSTQPTLVTTPLLSTQGEAIVQSTVDVFVNGQQIASDSVPPGPFTIDNLPPVTGAGQLQVVVTDAFGRQQVISQPYYSGRSLLAAGLNEYSVEVGAIREDYTARSNEYGNVVAAATFRRGFTDHFTAEVHAEGEQDGATAIGTDASLQVGTLGIVSATAAVGGQDGYGWLGGIGIERNGPHLSVFARTRYTSADFAQLGTQDEEYHPRQRSFAGVGWNFGRPGNLQLTYGTQSNWSGPRTSALGLSYSATLGDYGYLNLVGSRATGSDDSTSVFLGWTLPLGERRTASVSMQYAPDDGNSKSFQAVATLQQSLPPGSGSGYYVSISSDQETQLDYTYQGYAGLVGVQYARRNGEDGYRVHGSGGLGVTSAGVMPARSLTDSFAVVDLADYEGLTVYLENQPVGRTDAHGRVLLDSLRAYESNLVSIDPRELPLDASLSTTSMTVTPAWRSGPVVTFPVERASAATLRLVQQDGTPVPAGAVVTTATETAPVALNGLVYLTDAAGRQQASAAWNGHRCSFEFERPGNAGPQPNLGTVRCTAGATTAAPEPRP
ncbi:MAG: fimbria/pilus outer membrane usher protein [Steroidobacteraceae bacterium]